MLYVVLGMHKSGTTLLSQVLHHSGIDMGEIPDGVSYDKGNKYEDQESFHINMELIRAPDDEIEEIYAMVRDGTPISIYK